MLDLRIRYLKLLNLFYVEQFQLKIQISFTDGRVEDNDVSSGNSQISCCPTVDENPVRAKTFVLVDRGAHGTPIYRGRITY
jgi:hypothetical protein